MFNVQDYNSILPVLIIELGHLILMVQRYPSKAQDGKLCFAGRLLLWAKALGVIVLKLPQRNPDD